MNILQEDIMGETCKQKIRPGKVPLSTEHCLMRNIFVFVFILFIVQVCSAYDLGWIVLDCLVKLLASYCYCLTLCIDSNFFFHSFIIFDVVLNNCIDIITDIAFNVFIRTNLSYPSHLYLCNLRFKRCYDATCKLHRAQWQYPNNLKWFMRWWWLCSVMNLIAHHEWESCIPRYVITSQQDATFPRGQEW